MRVVGTYSKQLLAGTDVNFCILAFVDLKNNPLYMTSHPSDLVFGGNTYVSDNRLVAVDPPRQSTAVDKESYKVMLSDADYSLKGDIQGSTGRTVEIWAPLYNTSDVLMGSTYPDEPLLEEPMLAYKGTIDGFGYGVEDGSTILTIECASPMSALGLVKAFYTSKDYAKRRNAGDTSFDQVYAGSKSIDLLWGRK